MRGSTFKRCPCGFTGTPGKPACKKSHGSWSWRADAGRDPETGKRRQSSGSGYSTRDEAQEALNGYLAAQQTGTWADDKRTTVGEWLTTWLDECRERLEPKTVVGYESHVRLYLTPHLGHLRLRDLRRGHIEALLRAVAAPAPEPKRGRKTDDVKPGRGGRQVERRAGRTVDGVRRTLRAALSTAQRRGLVAVNVAEGRFDAMPRIGRPDTKWWQPEEVAAFLGSIEVDRLVAMYELAAFAGLRRGELLGLRWEDVDLDGRGLTVRQSLSGLAGEHSCRICGGKHRGRRFKAPKTDAGLRWVPLVDTTVSALLTHRAAQEWERQQWGEAYRDHGLVFALEDGTPLRPDTISKTFDAKADVAGLPSIRLHDMRHGAASLMLAAGVPVETVAMILGHGSPAVTRQVYAHVLREPARVGLEAAAALVRPARRAQSVHSQGRSDGDGTGGER